MAKIQDTTAMDIEVKKRKLPLWALILIGLAVVAIPILYKSRTLMSWAQSDRSIARDRIQTAVVERGTLQIEVLVDGRIVAANHVNLFSQDPGVVQILKREGEEVAIGDVVATVASPELKNRLNQEHSELERLQSELKRDRIENKNQLLEERQETERSRLLLETAKRNLERNQKSFEAGLVQAMQYEASQDELKLAELNYNHRNEKMILIEESLEFEIHNRELEVRRQELVVNELKRRVDALQLKSPIEGLVGSLPVKDLDPVAPNQPIATLVDLTHFEVEMDIPEAYGDRLALGMKATMTYENQLLEGRISRISPEVIRNQIKGTVSFSDGVPEGMKQNKRVAVKVHILSKPNVLKVRRGPFLEASGGNQVYLVDGQLAHLQSIRTGVSSLKEVEIVEGLEPGQEVIISDMSRFGSSQTLMISN